MKTNSRAMALMFALFGCGNVAAVAEGVGTVEQQVKSAFVFNFTKFVDWPVGGSGKPLTVCLLAGDDFGRTFSETVRGKSVHGRQVAVTRVSGTSDLRACDVLYVGREADSLVPVALRALAAQPTLTVADLPEFTQAGGMIALRVDRGQVRFDINLTAAKRVQLSINSQLLQLARKVDSK